MMSARLKASEKVNYGIGGTNFTIDRKYTDLKLIGKGSYGVVCSAYDISEERQVAIKKISPMAKHTDDAKYVLREIRLMRLLGRHHNIISLTDLIVREASDELYIVMELLDSDLHRVIQSNQVLSEDHVKFFFFQLLCGVKYLHDNHIIHRDLKPGNLLVTKDCQLRITDFGLARHNSNKDDSEEEALAMTEHVVTRWYRPPELMLCPDGLYSYFVDMWSCGCILGELLGRTPLFPGKNFIHQLSLIFDIIGSPSVAEVAHIKNSQAKKFLDSQAGKSCTSFHKVYPKASIDSIELLDALICFQPNRRLSADDALNCKFVRNLRQGSQSDHYPTVSCDHEFDFEHRKPTRSELKGLIIQEAQKVKQPPEKPLQTITPSVKSSIVASNNSNVANKNQSSSSSSGSSSSNPKSISNSNSSANNQDIVRLPIKSNIQYSTKANIESSVDQAGAGTSATIIGTKSSGNVKTTDGIKGVYPSPNKPFSKNAKSPTCLQESKSFRYDLGIDKRYEESANHSSTSRTSRKSNSLHNNSSNHSRVYNTDSVYKSDNDIASASEDLDRIDYQYDDDLLQIGSTIFDLSPTSRRVTSEVKAKVNASNDASIHRSNLAKEDIVRMIHDPKYYDDNDDDDNKNKNEVEEEDDEEENFVDKSRYYTIDRKKCLNSVRVKNIGKVGSDKVARKDMSYNDLVFIHNNADSIAAIDNSKKNYINYDLDYDEEIEQISNKMMNIKHDSNVAIANNSHLSKPAASNRPGSNPVPAPRQQSAGVINNRSNVNSTAVNNNAVANKKRVTIAKSPNFSKLRWERKKEIFEKDPLLFAYGDRADKNICDVEIENRNRNFMEDNVKKCEEDLAKKYSHLIATKPKLPLRPNVSAILIPSNINNSSNSKKMTSLTARSKGSEASTLVSTNSVAQRLSTAKPGENSKLAAQQRRPLSAPRYSADRR